LAIVRHAKSLRNELKRGHTYFIDDEDRARVRGIPDHKIPITSEGHLQALATGIALRERFGTFDYAYHSGYLRTVETLDDILFAWPEEERERIQVRTNPFIRERDTGYTYDMTVDEAHAAFPWLEEYWQTVGGYLAQPPGGESLIQVSERVYTFLNMLFRDRAGESILVVTHGGTLRSFRANLERWTYEQATKWPPGQSPRNCSLTLYEFDPTAGRLALVEHNTIFYEQ